MFFLTSIKWHKAHSDSASVKLLVVHDLEPHPTQLTHLGRLTQCATQHWRYKSNLSQEHTYRVSQKKVTNRMLLSHGAQLMLNHQCSGWHPLGLESVVLVVSY